MAIKHLIIVVYDDLIVRYAHALREYLDARGIGHTLVKMSDPAWPQHLQRGMEQDPAAVISISYHAMAMITLHGKSLLDFMQPHGVPVVFWNIDHPVMMRPLIDYRHPNLVIVHACRPDWVYWRNHVSGTQVSTWTEGVGRSQDFPAPDFEKFDERSILVLAPMNVAWQSRTPDDVQNVLFSLDGRLKNAADAAIETAKTDPMMLIGDAVTSALEAEDLQLSEPRFNGLTRLVLYAVQHWRRRELLRQLSAVPAIVDGAIPEDMKPLFANGPARLLSDNNIGKTLDRMKRTKIVLSISYDSGFWHDRVTNALHAGVIPLVERNQVHAKHLSDGETALMFDYRDRPIAAVLAEAMADPARLRGIAEAGHRFIKADGVDHRLDQVLEAINAARAVALDLTRVPIMAAAE
jgi:hypothetical protein